MRAERPLRIPLQIGTSALSSLVLTAAYFVPGSILVVAPVTLWAYLDFADLGELGGYALLPGAFVCGLAWKYLLRARAQRPSDLLLARGGFEVRGGPNADKLLAWSDITRVTLETPQKQKSRKDDDSDLKQLCVYRGRSKAGQRIELAAADRPSEQRSLVELARTLEAGRGALPEYQRRTAAKEDAVALLVCGGCGAAVAPADAATVVCAHCKAAVGVGDEVRKRLRDEAEVARRPDAAVARLLDQPGAGSISALLAVAALFMLSAWPVALVLATRNYVERAFTLQGTAFLLLFVVACVIGFFGLIRGRLVDRQALRLVALDFGAIPPAEPGNPYLCRRCLAPLQARSEQALVRCVYCRSDNVLGIDLHRDAKVAREESQSLSDALQRRASERRRWRGVSLAGLALLAVSAYSLRHGIGHNEKTWPLERRCGQNDLEACAALAGLISQKDAPDVRVDFKRAAALYARACKGSLAGACQSEAALCRDPELGLSCGLGDSGGPRLRLGPAGLALALVLVLVLVLATAGLWFVRRRPRAGRIERASVSESGAGALVIEREGGHRTARRLADGVEVAFDSGEMDPPSEAGDCAVERALHARFSSLARVWMTGEPRCELHGLQPAPATPLVFARGEFLYTGSLLKSPPSPLPLLVLHRESLDAGAAEVLTWVNLEGTTRWRASFPQPTVVRAKSLFIAAGRLVFVLGSSEAHGGSGPAEALALDASTGAVLWLTRL